MLHYAITQDYIKLALLSRTEVRNSGNGSTDRTCKHCLVGVPPARPCPPARRVHWSHCCALSFPQIIRPLNSAAVDRVAAHFSVRPGSTCVYMHEHDVAYSVVCKKVTVLLSTSLAWPNFSRNLAPTFLHNPVYLPPANAETSYIANTGVIWLAFRTFI